MHVVIFTNFSKKSDSHFLVGIVPYFWGHVYICPGMDRHEITYGRSDFLFVPIQSDVTSSCSPNFSSHSLNACTNKSQSSLTFRALFFAPVKNWLKTKCQPRNRWQSTKSGRRCQFAIFLPCWQFDILILISFLCDKEVKEWNWAMTPFGKLF